MNKEFIPYEQALELKEIGFDEPCICVYDDKNIHRVEQGDNTVLFKTVINSRLPDKFCSAPLYQQAFRWFREKYKIRFFIQSGMSDLGEFFKVIFPNGEQRNMSYTTYEEAELACIIKLIDIVKTKTT